MEIISKSYLSLYSWGILKTPRSIKIVETTTPRVAYYGFAMDEEMAKKFADENL